MERSYVSIYGSRAGTIAVDTLLGYGPGARGLVMLDVDYGDGTRPLTVALEPVPARELSHGLVAGLREIAESTLRVAPAPRLHLPGEEAEALLERGLPSGPVQAADRTGRLANPTPRRLHAVG